MVQGLDLAVRSVEIEMGPSQFEFTFEPGRPVNSRTACKLWAAR